VAGRVDDVVISVEAAALVDDDLCAAVDHLVPQLSRSSPPPSRTVLERIVADGATTLFVARDDSGGIVGMLTLATFQIPTGMRAWIEDVVVDDAARGAGAAAALVQAALDHSAELGARTVDLTSRPDREAANRLYLRMGFETRQTNVYRRTLEAPQ
jgi:ribosomal protein S18 acetylase RimI-like enzyme